MAFDKVIRIFIGSSIEEFKYERAELDSFIADLSERYFEDRYNVRVKAERCEKIDPAVSLYDSKQHEYNEEMIGKSDICIFLFFTRAGEYTQEEFEDAVRRFKESNGSKPKVYVYFKIVPDGVSVDKSIEEFKSTVDKAFGHYFGMFDNLDTVKLRILLSLKMEENGFCEVEYKDGGLQVNGQKFAAIDLGKVNEFEHNEGLKELLDELAVVEKEYFRLKPSGNLAQVAPDAYRRYATVAAKRQRLSDSIEELKGNIFKLSMRISTDAAHGDVTPRMKEAYRLLDMGDSKGCLEVLDGKERKAEYLRRKEQRLAEAKLDATYFIREGLLEISVLETLTEYKDRFDRIREIYEDILPEVMEYEVELKTLSQYVTFLDGRKDYARAVEVAEEAIEWLQGVEGADEAYVQLGLAIAAVYVPMQRYADAEKLYDAVIAKLRAMPQTSSVNFSLIGALSDKGALYLNTLRLKEAAGLLSRAYQMSLKLGDNQNAYVMRLGICSNLGTVLLKLGMLRDAANLLASCLKDSDKGFKTEYLMHCRATCFRLLGMVFLTAAQEEAAEKYFAEARRIWTDLARNNPVTYEGELAQLDYLCASLYAINDDSDEADKCCDASIKVYERVCQINPEVYAPPLAMVYRLKGDLREEVDEAMAYYEKAIGIMERYASANLSFVEGLINIYCVALEKCYEADMNDEMLAIIDKLFAAYAKLPRPHTFSLDGNYALACLRKAEYLYAEKDDSVGAMPLFKVAAYNFERMAKADPENYEEVLLLSYVGYVQTVVDICDEKEKEDAKACAEKALVIAEKYEEIECEYEGYADELRRMLLEDFD